MKAEPSTERSSRQCARRRSVRCSQGEAHCTGCIKGWKLLGAQKRMSISSGKNRHQQHETEDDTEVGMLSGVSRKRSIRSNPCWFTEFCKSQCLSHFAAPFIVVRAETSVAESCVTNVFSHYRISEQWCQVTRQQESNGRTVPFHINCCPRVSRQGY